MEKGTVPTSETTAKIEGAIEETNAAVVINEAAGNDLAEEKKAIIEMGKASGLTEDEIEKLIQEGTPLNASTGGTAEKKDDIITVEAEEIKGPITSNAENIAAGESISPFIEPENKGFFNKMSTGGKKIMSMAYEGIYKIPVVNRAVAKMEIAYNQFWIDKKEEKSVELKGKMDGLDIQSKTFGESKQEIISVMEDLKKEGNPGAASLQLKIKEIEREEAKIANKKNTIQSKIELRENKIKIFTNKRDQVADKLIGKYEKKLSPLEGKLENLQVYKDKLDLFVVSTEAKHEEQTAKLNIIKERKQILEQKFMSLGQSDRQIRRDKTIKFLEEQIETGHQKIEVEKKIMNAKNEEMNKKIAKADAKAMPYRDMKDEFIRVKDRRPIKIDLKEREKIVENKTTESTTSHTRTEAREETKAEQTTAHTREPSSATAAFENMPAVSQHILSINEYLKRNNASELQINQHEFLRATKLTEGLHVTQKKFKEIIAIYYKNKKIPESKYLGLLNNIK